MAMSFPQKRFQRKEVEERQEDVFVLCRAQQQRCGRRNEGNEQRHSEWAGD